MSVDWKNKAFHLFCNGKTLREIAELLGYHRSTIERWSVLYQWRKHREVSWAEARKKAQADVKVQYGDAINHVSSKVLEALELAVAERQAYFRGEIPLRKMKVSGRMLVSLAKAYSQLDRSILDQIAQIEGSK